jgi:hypothetical protein
MRSGAIDVLSIVISKSNRNPGMTRPHGESPRRNLNIESRS